MFWGFWKERNVNMNKITVNGKTITCSGNSVSIIDGQIFVDGKVITESNSRNIEVVIEGDIEKINCSGAVEVHGNAGYIDCGGSCTVKGDVNGSIDASGSVTCGNVTGDIDAGGSVRCRK